MTRSVIASLVVIFILDNRLSTRTFNGEDKQKLNKSLNAILYVRTYYWHSASTGTMVACHGCHIIT